MAGEYSLPDLLERMYENQLALEAALMELALQSEKQGMDEVGDNVRTWYSIRDRRKRRAHQAGLGEATNESSLTKHTPIV